MPFEILTDPRVFIHPRYYYIVITSLVLQRPHPPVRGWPEKREPAARNCYWSEGLVL